MQLTYETRQLTNVDLSTMYDTSRYRRDLIFLCHLIIIFSRNWFNWLNYCFLYLSSVRILTKLFIIRMYIMKF